jgi:glycerol-3-phosphate cytidylyltransferase
MSSDEYIKSKKGYEPPVPFDQRFMHLSALRNEVVDMIDVQTIDFGKKEAIDKYNPDVLFVGNDWTPETYTGEGLGVPVVYLPHTDGISSTILREKLEKNKGLML